MPTLSGKRRLRSALLPLVAVLGVASSASAAPYTKAQCVEADDRAQSLRREGKLAEVRAQLAICADPVCPGLVRDDCSQRLDELERVQPSVVFEAKDDAGNDLTAVKVTVDGSPLLITWAAPRSGSTPGRIRSSSPSRRTPRPRR